MSSHDIHLSPDVVQDKDIEELPKYTPSCLKPFTAVQNIRYDRQATPQYLPSGWQECNNPEGSRYYVNESIHAITDSPIHRPEVYEALERGLREYEAAVAILEKPLPQRSEIFIQLDSDNIGLESCKCNYYFVDHETQTEFWLHPTDSYALGLGRVTSESHLSMSLIEVPF
ncbi:hypothetical protein EIP86_002907 [Pleurotus ostreatoroseus]|nr:hypothetical protein EIP86_002907 [Pleurotus ostreatoroseus]